jgi:predicted RecB family nuclease
MSPGLFLGFDPIPDPAYARRNVVQFLYVRLGRHQAMQITENLFAAYCHCPYKAFLKSKGDVGEVADYEVLQKEADARFKEHAIERLLRNHTESQVAKEPTSLRTSITAGFSLILGAAVEASDVTLTFDLLERQIDRDDDRRTVYVPVLFSHKHKLTRYDSPFAAFHGIILGEALGQPVPYVKIVHGPGFTVSKIKLVAPSGPARLVKETRQLLDRLKKQIEATSPPLMILNTHCSLCEFRGRCHTEAVNRDDLSLLRGMTEKEILAQRKRGITTVAQFACTFRPKSIGLKRSKPLKRHLLALQALAIRDKKVYMVRAPEIPAKTTRVYLDVEGLPDRDFYYLVGVVIENDGQLSAHSFWADDETEEQANWIKLLDLLRGIGDCTIFHYGAYEKAFIKKMLGRYSSPDSPFPGAPDSALFNVLGAIRTNVYFPVYSNGLKDIASLLGVNWTGKIISGIDCVAARMRWEETRDSVIKDEIVNYNRQDCLALQRVANFLLSLGSPESTGDPLIQKASEIRVESDGKFGQIDFAIPEMGFINKCARFEYQRNKVLVRTDPATKANIRRTQSRTRLTRRANLEIRCNSPSHCSACGGDQIRPMRNRSTSKVVLDLKFTRTGVKRWIVKYHTERTLCLECGKTFYSDHYPTDQNTGHNLTSWAVYQHVALRLSFEDVALSVNDIFGYCYSPKFSERAQTRLADTYRVTVDQMLNGLRSGNLIHADETKVRLKRSIVGYVWAFTSTETVVYLYHPTREGIFLKETLGDFAGVLVSDFYAAYDSVTCRQQKCHLHLMRDINDDLAQHPFDEEMKELARRYTVTLKAIVETVDKHGLRAKFLSRHKRSAETFLEWIAKSEITSDVAQGYKSRVVKYGERLFTFLDFDGVPWNNNNAENALKLVASRRRLFGTSVSEAGLKDYLVFLSIYQTLRRKGISLLRFLLSGEIDLEKFVTTYRRR